MDSPLINITTPQTKICTSLSRQDHRSSQWISEVY